MSPTSRELVSNRALSGDELRRILLSDFTTLLDGHGLLTGQMAYARIAFDIRLSLHLDAPTLHTTEDHARSRQRSDNDIAIAPALAAIPPTLPLPGASPDAILTGDNIHRDIASPNVARLEHGLPITVSSLDNDAHMQEHSVCYPRDYPGMESTPPTLTDVTAQVRSELGMPPEPAPEAELAATLAEEARNEP